MNASAEPSQRRASGLPAADAPTPLTAPAAALVRLVKLYRSLPRSRPPSCRFDPTCSGYALGALRRWGALRGSALALRRVLRCHPWGGWGYDPVPERGPKREPSPRGALARTANAEQQCSM